MRRRARFAKRKIMLYKVNVEIYFATFIFSFATNLNEMRLAIDAIRVPRPPRFTPIRSAEAFFVKPERSIAAGTFEKIWLERTPEITSLLETALSRKARTGATRPRFPMNMKRKTNVRRREKSILLKIFLSNTAIKSAVTINAACQKISRNTARSARTKRQE